MVEESHAVDREGKKPENSERTREPRTWLALYGFLFVSIGLAAYFFGVALGPIRWMLLDPPLFRQIDAAIVWYSGIPLVAYAWLGVCAGGRGRRRRHRGAR